MVWSSSAEAGKMGLGGVKVPMCRMEVSSQRTWWIVNFGGFSGVVVVMVPVSEGWPPPWAWKIVDGVVRM
jgi:hypothetical protein